MARLLIWVGLGFIAWWWLRRRLRGPGHPSASAVEPAAPSPQAMVRCAHCGVHLPAAEALPGPDARPYCSDAHRVAGPGAAASSDQASSD
ncbi:MAG: PP0621 family protein [Burkholderiales bacterium]